MYGLHRKIITNPDKTIGIFIFKKTTKKSQSFIKYMLLGLFRKGFHFFLNHIIELINFRHNNNACSSVF